MDFSNFSLKELAAFISQFLRENKVDCILSGGACVSIYTDNKYMSDDLDFVPYKTIDSKKLQELLSKIGFSPKNRYYINKTTKYFIEFPAPPPTISDDYIENENFIEARGYSLKLLTPLDCVKDRLCSYFFFNDEQCMHQAILVIKEYDIDISEQKKWATKEGETGKFKVLMVNLNKGDG